MKIKTIFEVTTSTSYRTNRKETKETISVDLVGQDAANAVDKKYKGTIFRKVLKGFLIGTVFTPLHLGSR